MAKEFLCDADFYGRILSGGSALLGGLYEVDGGTAVTLFPPLVFGKINGGAAATPFDVGSFMTIDGGGSVTVNTSTINGGFA